MAPWVYILICNDGSYYTGTTRTDLEVRIAQHNAGTFGGFTYTRRPVTLCFSEQVERIDDAISAEHQINGWSRAKKEALIGGDFERLKVLSKRRHNENQCVLAAVLRDAASGGSSG